MKKILSVFMIVFASCYVHAQITTEQIKTGLAGKEWAVVKYEQFGVADEPKPEQANDKIVLNADMSFVIIENGKEYKGKWTMMKPVEYINCKATTGAFNKTYRVISIGEKESVIQFKDPDLIKTNYYLIVK